MVYTCTINNANEMGKIFLNNNYKDEVTVLIMEKFQSSYMYLIQPISRTIYEQRFKRAWSVIMISNGAVLAITGRGQSCHIVGSLVNTERPHSPHCVKK